MSDPQYYRSKEEVEEYRRKDPIEILKRKILEEGLISAQDLDALEDKVKEEVKAAHEFAANSPFPSPSEIFTDIFA